MRHVSENLNDLRGPITSSFTAQSWHFAIQDDMRDNRITPEEAVEWFRTLVSCINAGISKLIERGEGTSVRCVYLTDRLRDAEAQAHSLNERLTRLRRPGT